MQPRCRFQLVAEMNVIITGSRDWSDADLIWKTLILLRANDPAVQIVHGCARGADRIADQCAAKLRIPALNYPAYWEDEGRAAGLIRNERMLRETNPVRVVAFKGDFSFAMKRGGTEHMCRIARAAGIPVHLVRHGRPMRRLR